jgi:uncharacterized membrane protein
LSAPTLADVQLYRGYLANYAPIAEIETRFLDAADDLVCVVESDEDMVTDEEDIATPMSRPDLVGFDPRRRASILSQSDISRRHDDRSTVSQEQDVPDKPSLLHLSVAMAVAIVIPILTFLVIPGFIGRMTVVSLVAIGTLGALVQGKVIGVKATQEFCVSVGLYGGVMAVLAGMVN